VKIFKSQLGIFWENLEKFGYSLWLQKRAIYYKFSNLAQLTESQQNNTFYVKLFMFVGLTDHPYFDSNLAQLRNWSYNETLKYLKYPKLNIFKNRNF
jgi:hypothetical protein